VGIGIEAGCLPGEKTFSVDICRLSILKADLNNWRFIGGGIGIHWEALDEDISVEGLMN
jgi:hypothetical protein